MPRRRKKIKFRPTSSGSPQCPEIVHFHSCPEGRGKLLLAMSEMITKAECPTQRQSESELDNDDDDACDDDPTPSLMQDTENGLMFEHLNENEVIYQ